MSIILLLTLICFVCGNVYIYMRSLQTMRSLHIIVKAIYTLLFWLCALSLFIVLSLRHSDLPDFIPRTMYTIGSVWLVFVLYMTVILFIFDAIKRFFVPNMRRGFIYSLLLTITINTCGYINYLHPDVNRIDIAIDKPIAGDSMRIVGISDLHLGYGTGKKRLSRFVEMINAEKPDVILIAGDLIDNSIKPLYEQRMYEELNMLQATMGIYMSPGNHEYITGIEDCKEFLSKTPIKMLIDSMVELPNGVQIVLRDDPANVVRPPAWYVLKKNKTDMERPVIIADHHPYGIAEKDTLGIDLQFSGHTHNGQIWPGNIVTSFLYEQSNGYRKWKHSHVYVSSGLSLWGPPFRIGTDSDMVVFNIYSTKQKNNRE